ncbi:hypothetical protein [Saccharopolyspora spinosa]|uniref:hypothetical protein n=1 Tax=Saccharopolyspora spinosa TaxID=60894 RepID=UPI000237A40E|nr:hypothetical protein [Saccharopolyspora spinosa]
MTDEHRGCSRRQFLAYAAVAVPLAACSKQSVAGQQTPTGAPPWMLTPDPAADPDFVRDERVIDELLV